MTVFLSFLPAASTPERLIEPGPVEWFTSVSVALSELEKRGRDRRGHRALAEGLERFTYRTYQRAKTSVEFPDAAEGEGGWVALVWWRKACEPVPVHNDPAGEVWLSVGQGQIERRRVDPSQWNTGHGRRAVPRAQTVKAVRV